MHEQQRRAIESSGPPHASDARWTEVEPLLDESVASLRETDRRAVLLRFYQRKTFGEVASAIGATEEAARKRVARAVDRLRLILGRRGVALPAGALPAMLWNHTAASSAPATVVAAVSCAAPASVVAASTPSALLAKGAILMIGLHKAKSAAVAAVVLIFTGALVVALVGRATAQVDSAAAHHQRQPATAPAADAAEKQQKLMQVTPILQVEDLQASLDYYVTHLGFQTQFTHGDPANFASIQRDGLAIFLQQGGGHGGTQAWVYLMVSDVDALHEEIKERGAEVADAPVDRPWGMREMLLVDPDGNRLRVGTMRH